MYNDDKEFDEIDNEMSSMYDAEITIPTPIPEVEPIKELCVDPLPKSTNKEILDMVHGSRKGVITNEMIERWALEFLHKFVFEKMRKNMRKGRCKMSLRITQKHHRWFKQQIRKEFKQPYFARVCLPHSFFTKMNEAWQKIDRDIRYYPKRMEYIYDVPEEIIINLNNIRERNEVDIRNT